MNLIIGLLFAVHIFSAGWLLVASFTAIVAMNGSTHHGIRAGYLLLAIAAFAALIWPFFFAVWIPSPDSLAMLGSTVLLVANKRGAIINLGREMVSPLGQGVNRDKEEGREVAQNAPW